ncbi:MAG: SRPBCC family protein [Halolamina sp.]
MREVVVDRVVEASRPIVARALDPASVVEYEDSFDVRAVRDDDEGTLVVADGGRFVSLAYRFVDDGDAARHYEMPGDDGPFSEMETWIRLTAVDDGTRVSARSTVGLDVPLPFGDRIAAWKRRGELRRLLTNLAADVE